MIFTRMAWGFWALVPVAAVAYHYGPGQRAYVVDLAATLQNAACDAQTLAQAAQDIAYAAHLDAIDARKLAIDDPTPQHQAQAVSATTAEVNAYNIAAEQWKETATRYQEVLTALDNAAGDASPSDSQHVRWAMARANVRAGEVWSGIEGLEQLLADSESAQSPDPALAQAAREELAGAYYYGARLLRLSGMPVQEWRVESGKARQHFRYLAEQNLSSSDPELLANSRDQQRNLELVLNLEQSSLAELQGKPLPRSSPHPGNCNNGNRKGANKSGKKPGLRKNDARDAGGAEEIRDGW